MSYSSSNTNIAEVSQTGLLTIKNAGSCKITLKAAETSNYKEGKKVIKVSVKKAKTVLEAFGDIMHPGDKHNVSAQCSSDGKLTYESSDKKIATVNKKGVVTAKKTGTVKITVKAAATKNYKAAKTTVTVKVIKK